MRYDTLLNGKRHRLELQRTADHCHWQCKLDGRELALQAQPVGLDTLAILIDGKSFEVPYESSGDHIAVFIRGTRYEVSVEDPRSWRGRGRAAQDEAGPQKLIATMPGKVVRVLAREGDTIVSGQGIAVVEAMKMQNEIRSPRAGVLKKLLAYEGMKVNAGELLAVVE